MNQNVITIIQSYEKPHSLQHMRTGRIYDVSIQELNNLIGELDSFQREHEMKMRLQNKNNSLNGVPSMILPSSRAGDIYSNSDRSSIFSNEPNPLMCSTQSEHSSDMAIYIDSADGTPVENVSFGESGDHSNQTDMTNKANENSGGGTARNIELIPDSYNVSDNYVKKHTEIVVLRCKDSLSERSNPVSEKGVSVGSIEIGKESSERISSFRSLGFSKPDRDSFPSSTNHHRSSGDDDKSVIFRTNECNISRTGDAPTADASDSQHIDGAHYHSKPLITPRPVSLSGLCKILIIYSSYI